MHRNSTMTVKRHWALTLALFVVFVVSSLVFTGAALAQNGTPGNAIGVEIDANYRSGVIPAGALYPTGSDWSQGPTGSALLLQSGGKSVPGYNPLTNATWYVDQIGRAHV